MARSRTPQIRISDFRLDEEELTSIVETLRSGRISEGERVEQFEEEWARRVGTKYSVAFCSGSAALLAGLLAAKSIGLLSGEALLTNPNTFVGTVNCITLAGYEPAFVDIEADSFGQMATDQVSRLLETHEASKISGLLPVHLFGFPENLDQLSRLGTTFDKPLLEDAAQAHGSELFGKKLGSWGLFGAFSFYAGHTLQAGEMGSVATDSVELFAQLRSVKDQGRQWGHRRTWQNWFLSEWVGFNLKATEVSAAIALTQLRKVDHIVKARRHNAQLLTDALSKWSEVIQVPDFPDDVCPFAYPILIKTDSIGRERLRNGLEAEGVETRPMFPCIPTEQPAYAKFRSRYSGRLPNSERLSRRTLYIGCHQYLTEEDVASMVHAFEIALRTVV